MSAQPSNPAGGEKKINITKEEWERRLARAKLSKRHAVYKSVCQWFHNCGCSDMNKLVMNYLSTEGYKEAAEKFAVETGVKTAVDLSAIDSRMKIRSAIQNGGIEEAIEMINNIDPDVGSRLFVAGA